MPFCHDQGLGIMTYSPLVVGLLSGQFRYGESPPPNTFWGQRADRYAQIMTPQVGRLIEEIVHIGEDRGKTAAQVTIAWLLSHPELSTVIIGPDTPEQVEENVGAMGWELTLEERTRLDEVSQTTS